MSDKPLCITISPKIIELVDQWKSQRAYVWCEQHRNSVSDVAGAMLSLAALGCHDGNTVRLSRSSLAAFIGGKVNRKQAVQELIDRKLISVDGPVLGPAIWTLHIEGTTRP